MTSTLTQTAPRQDADAEQTPPDRLKAFIETRLRRRESPESIAVAAQACFGVALDPDQVVPYWKGEIALPTQTEHRQDKGSVQLPADQAPEPNFTLLADAETPAPSVFSIAPESTQTGHRQDAESPQDAATQTGRRQDAAPLQDAATQTGRRQDSATQTGHGQDAESPQDSATQTAHRRDADSPPVADSLQIPADTVDEPTAQDNALQALANLARARLGIPPDPATATQTGRRQNEETKSVLTDEVKAFIVRGLARYETPTRVAASVQANFGIAIDRRQVFAYDPAGSRRPAQRWIDLHAATRAKFLDAMAEIGIAQKVVRLQMLDRFARRAEENNYTERAAAFLAQAAKECGGFYERFARPNPAAAPA